MLEAMYWNARGTYKYIDTIICCSYFLKRKMDTNPVFKEKTVVLHNFVDPIKSERINKKGYVLYFGRFSREKGIETLIKACEKLPDIPFIFAGSGPLEDTIDKLSNIKNVGFQSGESLKRLIQEASFSVCPSECYENCPFSILESQAYGTPVLGADIGGIPELIMEGQTGELFESGNADDLKQKLIGMWLDKEKTTMYSENCLEQKWDTVEEYGQKLLKIYNV